jgi:hypothetical protein
MMVMLIMIIIAKQSAKASHYTGTEIASHLYKREQKDNILNGHLTHCPPLDEK